MIGALPTSQLRKNQDLIQNEEHDDEAQAKRVLIVRNTENMRIPKHDKQVIDESAAPTTTTITYSLSNVTVAVKTITVSGTTTTISMTYE